MLNRMTSRRCMVIMRKEIGKKEFERKNWIKERMLAGRFMMYSDEFVSRRKLRNEGSKRQMDGKNDNLITSWNRVEWIIDNKRKEVV